MEGELHHLLEPAGGEDCLRCLLIYVRRMKKGKRRIVLFQVWDAVDVVVMMMLLYQLDKNGHVQTVKIFACGCHDCLVE